MKDLNLFGELQEYPEEDVPEGPIQYKKRIMSYRKANILKGEHYCSQCQNFVVFPYHDKKYFKCKLIGISNSEATDIRAKGTCNNFK